jgi:hypothetical protein
VKSFRTTYEKDRYFTTSQTYEKALRYIAATGDKDLRHDIAKKALFILNIAKAQKAYGKPLSQKQKVKLMNQFLTLYPEMNPTVSTDTYGIEQLVARLSKNRQLTSSAKRLYRSMLDLWIKAKIERTPLMEHLLFENCPEEPIIVDD